MIGLQECRIAKSKIRSRAHYDMYIGAADKDGGHGCQVWVARSAHMKLEAYEAVSPLLTWVAGHIPILDSLCEEASPAAARDAF